MIRLFLESWAVQSLDWKIFYVMSINFVVFITYQFSKMAYISYKLYKLEKESKENPVTKQLDDMYRMLEQGFEVRPSRFLK